MIHLSANFRLSATRRTTLALIGAQVLQVPTRARGARAIIVASKSDTEGALVGQMIASAIEGLGLTVERRLGIGPTLILRTALLAGEIDICPEYTGNGAFFSKTDRDLAWKSSATAYERVREFDARNGLVWLRPAPANNTWAIAVNGAFARTHRMESMVDFARVVREDRIILAASTEFVESPAALPSFEEAYNFTMPRSRIFSLPSGDTSVTARAAAEGISRVNSGMVYGTDGALAALDLVTMTDSKGSQIVYEVAPVVRASILEQHPDIADALNVISAQLDADTLRRLNAEITVQGKRAESVARGFLRDIRAAR